MSAAQVALAAHAGGWVRVDAWHNEGWARGEETLTVTYAGERVVHVTYTEYRGDDAVRRESDITVAFALAALADRRAVAA